MYYDFVSALGFNFILILFCILALGVAKNSGKGFILFFIGLGLQSLSLYGNYHTGSVYSPFGMYVAVAVIVSFLTFLGLLHFQKRNKAKEEEAAARKREAEKANVDDALQSEQDKAVFCRKCGKKLAEDSQFCPYCGEKIF